jgi:hypothetical protein
MGAASAAKKKNAKSTKRRKSKDDSCDNDGDGGVDNDVGTFVVGFFHPRCSSGGGGERVLWKSIQALGELREGKLATKRRRGARMTATSPPSSYSSDAHNNI